MDARVRYVRSKDGTRIAYSVSGEGPALASLPPPNLSHIELYPRLPGAPEYLDRLGRGRKLIRIDFRGTGMAERACEDLSPDAFTDDLEAVIDDLAIAEVDIAASGAHVTPALGLAIRRPSLVKRLILANPYSVRPTPQAESSKARASLSMETDWELFLETAALRNTGRRISEMSDVIAFVRRCMDQRNSVATFKESRPELDWERAASIDIPVLVLDFVGNVHIPPGRVLSFSQQFRQGRYMTIPESALPPPYGDPELYLQAIGEFLGPPPAAKERPGSSSGLSMREVEVLRLLADGKTNAEIAGLLVLSPHTVGRHVSNIFDKIEVSNRSEAMRWAIRHGISE